MDNKNKDDIILTFIFSIIGIIGILTALTIGKACSNINKNRSIENIQICSINKENLDG